MLLALRGTRPRPRGALLVPSLLILVGCGDSGTTVTAPTQHDLTGTYSGPVLGVTVGFELDAVLTLNVTQDGGALSGSYTLSGTVGDDEISGPVNGAGIFTGTVATGDNPPVSLAIQVAGCPNYVGSSEGTFDHVNRRLLLSGVVHVLGPGCEILIPFGVNLVLSPSSGGT